MTSITKFSAKLKSMVLVLILLIGCIGCHNRDIDPQNPILGKWVEVQSDGKRSKEGLVYEYLPDSTIRLYKTSEREQLTGEEYRLNDSILYIGYFSNNRFSGTAYKYKFFDNKRKLRLVHYPDESTNIYFAPIPTIIYQRLK